MKSLLFRTIRLRWERAQQLGSVPLSNETALSNKAHASRLRAAQRGVTLVEVLIVVAIMAMISGGVAFALLPRMAETRNKTAKQAALEIRKMVQLWQTENGSDCPSLSQLKKDGYLDKAGTAEDPWGKPFEIRCPDGEVFVRSAGSDKKEGTPDDIEVPKAASEEGG
jgi:general secretion pathway protein G